MYKIGIIGGAGNMGKAILQSIIKNELCEEKDIVISGKNGMKLMALKHELKIDYTQENYFLAENSKVIILAVKPNMIGYILEEIKDKITKDKIIISIAAGITIEKLQNYVKKDHIKIARVMPNIPVKVGEGMCGIVYGDNFDEVDKQIVEKIFKISGRTIVISESKMDILGAISGSGPAFVYMFMESMANAGVLNGLDMKTALELSAQTMIGAAKLYLEENTHPAILKDEVCSPSGTTIEGVKALEDNNFRATIINAVQKTYNKSKNI